MPYCVPSTLPKLIQPSGQFSLALASTSSGTGRTSPVLRERAEETRLRERGDVGRGPPPTPAVRCRPRTFRCPTKLIVIPLASANSLSAATIGIGFGAAGGLDAEDRHLGPGEVGTLDAAVAAAAGTGAGRLPARFPVGFAAGWCLGAQPVLCRVSSCPCRRWQRSRRPALQRSPAVRTATSPVSVNACVPPCLRRYRPPILTVDVSRKDPAPPHCPTWRR